LVLHDRKLVRSLGARELANGVGVLTSPRTPAWMWARVGGDVVDLSLIAAALVSPRSRKGKLIAAAAVDGVTALDVICGQRLSREQPRARLTRSITIHGSVETGPEVRKVAKGDRVVVPSFICCGKCWYYEHELWSLCDNTNPNAELQEPLLGYPTAGIYGYTHAFGGYVGGHAQYVRVPHADTDCFKVPEGLKDEQVLFFSDAAPTGYMGAEFCNIHPEDTVALWGCGGVGLMAQKAHFCSEPAA
jgi:NADPH:quinone reductase-like Zn-dependent oxidoreductase